MGDHPSGAWILHQFVTHGHSHSFRLSDGFHLEDATQKHMDGRTAAGILAKIVHPLFLAWKGKHPQVSKGL